MRKFLASLDVGSSTIKLIVGEVVKEKVNILVCIDTPSEGIKKGMIINQESAKESIAELFKRANDMLGVPVNKVIAIVPSLYTECNLNKVEYKVLNEDGVIRKKDIANAIDDIKEEEAKDSREIIGVLPASFMVNDEIVSNPVNIAASKFYMKSIVVSVPKKSVEGIKSVLESIGVELVGVSVSAIADYYQNKNQGTINTVGAIINIGGETTTVSIINRGILTNSEVIEIGGNAITNDLIYVYKIDKEDALLVKEKLALAHTRLAQPNEALTLLDKNEDNIKINQYDASEIVMSRLKEILNLAKKQINLLTKKEISYIIITGGVAETQDFDILIEETLGNDVILSHTNEIGARHNKYGTAIGLIKYYNSVINLKDIKFRLFPTDDEDELCGIGKKINISDSSLLGKVIGYFFE